MTTKTFVKIGDIPQQLINECKDEFGMELLFFGDGRDALVIAGSSDRYCPDCEEYVDAVQEIGITWIGAEYECEWDEIGDEFCPACQNDALFDDEDDYAEGQREAYEEDRALDRWRGID